MIHRLLYRLRYGNYSLLLVGIIFLFLEEYHLLGVGLIIISIIAFIVLSWLINKMAQKHDYEADENGNAKPNYR